MRAVLPLLAALALGAGRAPIVIVLGQANAADALYGPADMLCDLNLCRLFNLPARPGLLPNTIVEFGIPRMSGQDRVPMRRCMEQLCRASVLGHPSERTSSVGHGNPVVFITALELRLE